VRITRRQLPSALAGILAGGRLPARGRPPNFLLIVADDLGYGDLGVYGSPVIRTPHLDAMAAAGVRFTSFYATPVCSPSRAALLTGRYPIRTGVIRVLHPGDRFGLPETELTVATVLRGLGYAAACIGKWHLGGGEARRPLRHGFEYYYGLLWSNDMNLRPPDFHRLRLWRNNEPIEWPVEQQTLTRRYTDEAIRFMENNHDRPFFLYLAHTMPHVPLHASAEFRGRSKGGLYGDVVEEIDFHTGRLLRALQRLRLEEDTLVLFTSDNGPAIGKGSRGGSAGPFRGGKGTTWEGGVRVPMVAWWPGRIRSGTVYTGIATVMDIFPTLIELAGGEVPRDRVIDGKSLLPALEGRTAALHSEYYYYHGERIHAVRSGDWKLHLYRRELKLFGPGPPKRCDPPELYNLAEDPGERFNLWRDHPKLVTRLAELAAEFERRLTPPKLPGPFRPRLPLIR
jgi:arylsulfatase A-like enzyme